MKKLLLLLSMIMLGLSGCYVRGYHDDGYHRGHDQHKGHDQHRSDDGREGHRDRD